MMRRGKIMRTVGIILLILTSSLILYMLLPYAPYKKRFWSLEEQLRSSLVMPKEQITEKDLDIFPPVLKAFYVKSGFIGKNKVSYVEYEFRDVDFVLGPNKPQVKMDYTIYNYAKEPTRIALIDTRLYGIPFGGMDSYIKGKGRMKGILAKHIPLFDVTGEDMDGGALVTYLAEAIMHPSLLMQDCITLEQLDDYTVKATIQDKGMKQTGLFHFNNQLEMTYFSTTRFSADTDSYEVWHAVLDQYTYKEGIRRPMKFQGIWKYKEGDLIYFDSRDMDITFH